MNEQTRVTVLDRLRKEIFKGINYFEFILLTSTTILGTLLFVLSLTLWSTGNNSPVTSDYIGYALVLADIPLGVLAATFLAKKNKYAPLLLTFDAILYGTSNFLAGNFALGTVNAIITPLIYIFAYFFIWAKKQDENSEIGEIETRKLNLFNGMLVFMGVIIISIFFGFFLPLIWPRFFDQSKGYEEEWLDGFSIWFDSFAAALMLMAVIMSALRFRETFYLYFTSNFIKIVLFSTTLIMGYPADMMLLIIAISYFINAIFGLLIWRESEKVDITKNKKITSTN